MTDTARIGLVVPYTDVLPRDEVVGLVEIADRLGYESVWVPEAYGWDAITLLTVLATRTTRIQLATGIINVFSRTPTLIAQTIGALDDISGGRAILGLGTSGPQVITGWHGIPFDKPVTRTRETVEVVRMALRRERVRYQGTVFTLPQGLKLITHPKRDSVPVALATITDAGVALTAEVADRWLPTLYDVAAAPEIFGAALERGRARRDPGLGELVVSPTVSVYVDDDVAVARDAVRPQIALYIGGMGSREKNFYNALISRYGYAQQARRIQDLYLGGDRAAAIAAVPDELVDRLHVVGPIERCRERIRALVDAGVVPILAFGARDDATRRRALEELAPAALAATPS
jgi:F420-dependent oxidoreductase-like protein